jgi:hypothetical protein
MKTERLVHLFHILFVGGLFLYVGINKDKIYSWLWNILYYLGLIIIIYHIYKLYVYMKVNKGIWVNLIHILIVGPILVYIGYNREKTTRKFFEILLMLGFASIGYHLYYLLNPNN